MSNSAIIVRDGINTHRLLSTHRDWLLLSGPGFAEGRGFNSAFGMFDNFTVARGITKGSQVKRDGKTLHTATASLLAGIKRDYELLRYDYSYKIADEPKRYGGSQSIQIRGRGGILSLCPKGYCSIKILDGTVNPPQVPELIDLRALDTVATDSGSLKIYRHKAETHWLKTLPPLWDFLVTRLNCALIIEHIE
ncbi:MAG: hypothetical protein M3O30_09340 [Planctomycetota bacterium]|nr:hypothetical protein [Planctomycetota bacterium]